MLRPAVLTTVIATGRVNANLHNSASANLFRNKCCRDALLKHSRQLPAHPKFAKSSFIRIHCFSKKAGGALTQIANGIGQLINK
jgi:hypothetical protein